MLKIFNELEPFFEDCYREISVRKYSRIMKMSAPTASTILKNYEKEEFLKKREDKGYLLFRINRENPVVLDLSRIYWKIRLKRITVILFGSLSKLEAKQDSDIDITIISKTIKKIDLNADEKELKRSIQAFYFKSSKDISKDLKANILKGSILAGEIE
jgi:predicted nucleotidyltransferase